MNPAAVGLNADARERGSSVIDFPFVFIFFFALLWGVFNFGFVFTLQSLVTIVAEDGARAALQYTPTGASNPGPARATNAQNYIANSPLTLLLEKIAPVTTTVNYASCPYNSNLGCFTANVQFMYGQHPIMPALVNFPIIGPVGVPQQLTATAVMQIDPANLSN